MAADPKSPMPAAKPPMSGAAPGEAKMPPPQEIQSLLNEIDSVIGKPGGESSAPMLPKEEKFSSTMPEGSSAEGSADVGPLAEALDISMEKAQAMYDAAQSMDKLAGKTPAELATMLEKDMALRMQLEKTAAGSEDEMKGESEGMKAPMMPEPPMSM